MSTPKVIASESVGEQADYGIVTALRDELAALRAVLGATEEVQLGDRDIRYYYRSRVRCQDGSEVVVVCACANDMGQKPALNLTRDLIAAWRPRHLLLIGIAGGFPGRGASHGDVIAPLQVHYYEPGKLVPAGAAPRGNEVPRVPRWRIYRASAKLHAAVEALALEEGRPWAGRIQVARPDGAAGVVPKILRADLASGEEVWASLESAIAQEVLSHSDKILGVENEAAGFLSAVEESAHPPDALVVKSFSDLVEGKDDRWRTFAATASATFAVTLIEKVGSRYGGTSVALSAQGKKRLEAAWKALDGLDYEGAAHLAEEAADLALRAGDRALEGRARRQAVRSWGDHLAAGRVSKQVTATTLSRIREHLGVLERRFEITPGHLAVEKARLKLFEEDVDAALALAHEALGVAEDGTTDWADALIFATQAYWHQGRAAEALTALGPRMERARSEGDLETRLVMAGTLFRTSWKAQRATADDVRSFCTFVRELVDQHDLERDRALLALQEVNSELGNSDASTERLSVCELAHDLAAELEDAGRAASIALEVAELAAATAVGKKALHYLGKAASWVERSRTAQASVDDDDAASMRAVYLFSRGRILFRLAGHSASAPKPVLELLRDALASLEEAETFGIENRALLRGDVELYLADVRWWRGRTAFELNRFDEAALLLRNVRSDAAMAHPRFSVEVGLPAWLLEAEAYYLGGHFDEALDSVDALVKAAPPEEATRKRAEAFKGYLSKRVKPLREWLESADAGDLRKKAKATCVREVVAQQLDPLIQWWDEWRGHQPAPPYSEILDFWARGGFVRAAAAIRAKPMAAIAVDTRSLDDIRLWARVFCPLFETVVMKWKGDLGCGMVLTPMDMEYGGPGAFGGHGYNVTSSLGKSPKGRPWPVAMSWANPLPRELAAFLATEALPLFKAGRLLVVPAPLVGCTQTAVGWTDHLLVDGLLGGAVNVIGAGEEEPRQAGRQRVLDLSKVAVPYIEDVPLSDLASVLAEMEDWLSPLRSLLFRSILSQDLRHENWQAISAMESDIRDACRGLREHLTSIAKGQQWRVADEGGAFAAALPGPSQAGREPVTDLLRAISPNWEVGPWIPYWRLESAGGRLDWTCPLDNPSEPTDRPDQPEIVQSWLWPGTGGWGMILARRVP